MTYQSQTDVSTQWGSDAPLVSIIIPIYKVGPFVRKCLESVASQTYPNIETIIVNDATPDDSMVVVQRSLEGVPNVRIIELEENAGLGNARNVGMDRADGKYVFFLDSDDWIDETTIEKAVTKALAGDAQVVVIDFYKVNHATLTKAKDRTPYAGSELDVFDPKNRQSVLRVFNLAQIKLYQSAFLKENGFQFKSGIIYEDVDWTFKVMTTANKVAIVDEPLYYYRVARPGSILSSKGSRHFDVLKQYEDVFEHLRENDKLAFLHTVYSYGLNAVFSVLVAADRIPNGEKRKFFNEAKRIFKKARGKRKFKVTLYNRYKFDAVLLRGNYAMLRIWRSNTYRKFRDSRLFLILMAALLPVLTFARRITGKVRAWARPKIYKLHPKYPDVFNRFFGPVKTADVIFASYWGDQFSDSPKYVYEYLKEHHPDVRCVFALKPEIKADIPKEDRVSWGSYPYRVALANAKVWINNNNFTPEAEKADDQLFIQTFHGIPLKKLGTDMIGHKEAGKPNWNALVQRCSMWDYVVTSGAHHSETLRSAFQTNAKFLEIGSPRTDCLQDPAFRDHWGRKIREHYGLPEKARLVLYAPTWRKSSKPFMFERPQLEALLEQLGPDDVILYRKHHMAKGAPIDHDQVVEASAYPDSQHLCAASDMLITDYSSIALDFAATGRPAFFYVPDYDEYEASRGLYFDMRQKLEPVVFEDFRSLLAACSNAMSDPKAAKAYNLVVANAFLDAERADSCQRVVEELILPHLKK